MKKVRIYRPAKGLDREEELRRLLAEADCEVEDDTPAPVSIEGAEEAPSEDIEIEEEPDEAPVCIVILSSDLGDDPDLQDALDQADRDGCTIIGIWPLGAGGDSVVPQVFAKGDDTVAWDALSLRKALGSATPVCQAPDGGQAKTAAKPRLKGCG